MITWIILGIIYAICFIPAWFMTRVITSSHPMKRVGFFFLTVWLIMPLFPIYLLITYFKNYEQRKSTKKVGRQKKLTNPCPVIKGEVQIMVGSPKCITCQWFERKLEKDGKAYVHCNRL